MFPLRDVNPTTGFAWVNLVFVAVDVFVLAIWFLPQFNLGGSNTAWKAHVGGFVFGALVSPAFRSILLLHSRPHRPRLA